MASRYNEILKFINNVRQRAGYQSEYLVCNYKTLYEDECDEDDSMHA